MADNEDGEEKNPRANEWEVVSLTASAYAAAPGPEQVELKDDEKANEYGEDEAETSRALFRSGHFVFPPSQHENLPLEPDDSEIHDANGGKDVVSPLGSEEVRSGGKDDEIDQLKGFSVPDDFPGIQLLDEKGNKLSIRGKEFEEGTALRDLNFVEQDESMYSTSKYSSLHSEAALYGPTSYGESTNIPETTDPSEQGSNVSPDTSQTQNLSKEDKKIVSFEHPCGAWWKRRAASLYSHAKDTNAIWPIFIAAAVMGLVMLGQRWQQERWQALHLRWQTSINDERGGRMLGPISRLKDVIVGSHRRGSLISGSSSSES